MCGLYAAVYPLSMCASVCLPNDFQSLSNVHIVVSMISGSDCEALWSGFACLLVNLYLRHHQHKLSSNLEDGVTTPCVCPVPWLSFSSDVFSPTDVAIRRLSFGVSSGGY